MEKESGQLVHVFNGHNVRVTLRDGEPWFVAKDVCDVLGLTNVAKALQRLDADEKADVTFGYTSSQARKMLVINESGMNLLVLRSNKEQARPFQKWVTGDVLPTIRKTGKYAVKTDRMTTIRKLMDEEIGEKTAKIILALMPKKDFGSVAANGAEKTGLRAACFVARKSRNDEARDVAEMLKRSQLLSRWLDDLEESNGQGLLALGAE